ncbi:hypothetical protein K0M31_007137 [Melipona bicolor]|uniref:PiggyBac transposable element-derived protein domain-containing protein n=1 Tax=Melipona bicolor TaxID=60889 RepID=A0AA40FS21_9HYME|nr:hypothetical protein K0M31_007137 [Melipona bicolor]
MDNVVPENQKSGRNWQRIGPSKHAAIVSRQCSLITKSEHIQTIDESFHLLVDDKVVNNVILHINKKAKEYIPPEKQWKPVDRMEIDAFLGLLLFNGRYRELGECKHVESLKCFVPTILCDNNVVRPFCRYTQIYSF